MKTSSAAEAQAEDRREGFTENFRPTRWRKVALIAAIIVAAALTLGVVLVERYGVLGGVSSWIGYLTAGTVALIGTYLAATIILALAYNTWERLSRIGWRRVVVMVAGITTWILVVVAAFIVATDWIPHSEELWVPATGHMILSVFIGKFIGLVFLGLLEVGIARVQGRSNRLSQLHLDGLLRRYKRRFGRGAGVVGGVLPWTLWAWPSEVAPYAPAGTSEWGLYALGALTYVTLAFVLDLTRALVDGRPLSTLDAPVPVWASSFRAVPPEPKETLWTPDAVVGWRTWEWFPTTGDLVGPSKASWPTTTYTAACGRACNPVPGWWCSCGVYGNTRLQDLEPATRRNSRAVIGTVELSGRVIEHDSGYRAEEATIKRLWLITDDQCDATAELVRLRRQFPTVSVAAVPDKEIFSFSSRGKAGETWHHIREGVQLPWGT